VRSLIYIFTYVFVPVTVCTCVRIGCAPQLRCFSLPPTQFPAVLTRFHLFAMYDEKSRDRRRVQTWGAISRHFQVRHCWIKIDSSVNLGETPSSEFMQCVLWVIRLTKTVESICFAVRHTVTLPRAVWRTIRSPHSVRVLIVMMTDAGRHRPSAVGVVYYAVVTTRLLLSTRCQPIAKSVWWHSRFYTTYK